MLAPLWVKKEGEDIQHSSFKVFIERDDSVERGEDFFIRDGVTITGISSLRQKSIRVIVSVSDRPLSKLLGDSENPAHTEWQERSPKFRGRYVRGASCLRYVKNSPREIVKILSRPAEGRDIKLLRDLFYIDLPKAIEAQGSLKNRQKDQELTDLRTPGARCYHCGSIFAVTTNKAGISFISPARGQAPSKRN